MRNQQGKSNYLPVSVFCLLLVCFLSGCSKAPKKIFEYGGNIGNVLFPGAMIFDPNTNTYRLSGGGTCMEGTSDEFFMVWKEVTGDFTFSAKLTFEGEDTSPHSTIGLIIRKSLEPDAVYADVALRGDGLATVQYRADKGIEAQEILSANIDPAYVLLERKGNLITMKTGTDSFPGETEEEIELDLPDKCYVGLFVCPHNPGVMDTGYFSEVKLKKI